MRRAPVLDIRKQEEFRRTVDRVRRSLLAGGVIAFPTDTFYGLGADPFNPEAVEKLFHLKNREGKNPILVLIPAEKKLNLFTHEVNADARALIETFWPGPLTILFPALPSLPHALTAGSGKIGVRLPGSAATRHLLEEVGPLTATSANLAQGPNPETLESIPDAVAGNCDYLIDGGAATESSPSTLIDTVAEPPVLIREGVISRQQIEDCLGRKIA